jgi:hypothetical protein
MYVQNYAPVMPPACMSNPGKGVQHLDLMPSCAELASDAACCWDGRRVPPCQKQWTECRPTATSIPWPFAVDSGPIIYYGLS